MWLPPDFLRISSDLPPTSLRFPAVPLRRPSGADAEHFAFPLFAFSPFRPFFLPFSPSGFLCYYYEKERIMFINFTAKYTKIPSGYLGQLIEWPEVLTEGRDLEDCRALLRDALNEMILAYRQQGKEILVH